MCPLAAVPDPAVARWHPVWSALPMTLGGVAQSVLVVDSDVDALANTVGILSSAGYRVSGEDSFHGAADALTSNEPDVLIADVRLGGFNGLHLVWRRRHEHPGKPSVVTSATADPVLARDTRQLGAPYLVKPISREALLAAVVEAMSRSRRDRHVNRPIPARRRTPAH